MPNQAFDRAAALADMSRLLAACYYEPGPEFAEERLFDAMIDAAQRVGPALAEKASLLKTAFEADSQQDLLVDYAHLFLGPVGLLALPYESVWLEKLGVPSAEATQVLLDLFADGGFKVDPDFHDLPDHIAVELEFLYTVFFRMAAAIRDGDHSALYELSDFRQRLIDLHLGRWFPDFLAAVDAGAQCRFYRELVGMTAQFIAFIRREGA